MTTKPTVNIFVIVLHVYNKTKKDAVILIELLQ